MRNFPSTAIADAPPFQRTTLADLFRAIPAVAEARVVDEVSSALRVPTKAAIYALEDAIRESFDEGRMRPVELNERHHFVEGLYAREITIPAGTVITGKVHRREHLNIVSKGDITVWTEDGMRRVRAPFTICSRPGTKRVGYAHADTVWTTIHASSETALAKLEAELIEAPLFEGLKENACLGQP